MGMRVLYARCAGLDVHKAIIVACVLLSASSAKTSKQVRTFATTTAGLQELAAWLASQGVSHVAMESTGIYWRPVFNLLEGRFEVILVNAQHMKAVPGHKTDIKDGEWIADRLRHTLPALREALEGRVEANQRVLLRQLLEQIDFLQRQIDALSADIDHP